MINLTKKYRNNVLIRPKKEGDERRYETLKEMLQNDAFMPKPLEYKDIDEAFTKWVKNIEIISENGTAFPTMVMFSNQRFSEYSQSWKFVDENKNLLLNFKTISRENNPEYGKIQSGLWNIPGDRFYTFRKDIVLDDNGKKSFLVGKIKQPVSIDLSYKISIFTTKFTSINEFNTKINKLFSAKQAYISPNGHYIPMTLENISDNSQYNIDDRQFFSQTYQIKVMGYIITREDMKVEEQPLPMELNIENVNIKGPKADVEIEETEDAERTYILLIVDFKKSETSVKFNIDIDFICEKIEELNTISAKTKIYVDDNLSTPIFFAKENSEIKINIQKKYLGQISKLKLYGYKLRNN